MDIGNYYQGKAILITGVTGFMGKVLLEKVLRCLDVTTVCVVIRSKKGKSAKERLEKLFDSQLFERLAKAKPDFKEKVIPIEGEITLASYGISDDDMKLVENTAVVFHCAASVRFQEPTIDAIEANVRSVQGIISLTKKMKKFEVLVYLSTAYAHCYRDSIEEVIYSTEVSPTEVLNCVDSMDRKMLEKLESNLSREHPNTYTFTKAVAENLLQETVTGRSVIVRPSIVASTWKEPMPGWCDSYNGPVGLIVSFGKGLLRTMLGNRDSPANFVPVDVAINVMIAGAWRSAASPLSNEKTRDITIYNCTNGEDNHFTWGDVSDSITENAKVLPLEDPVRTPSYGSSITASPLKYRLEWAICHWTPAYLADTLLLLIGRERKFVRYYSKIRAMCDSLEYFTTRSWKWSNNNIKRLLSGMSEKDRKIFYIDFSALQWKRHMADYHAGVKKYMLKERLEDIPKVKIQIRIQRFFELLIEILFLVILMWLTLQCGMISQKCVVSMFIVFIIYRVLTFLSCSPA